MKNILSLIEQAASHRPEQIAVTDDKDSLSYAALLQQAQQIGSGLLTLGRRRPIAIYLEKTPACVAAMLGIAYSGNFYAVLDTLAPAQRNTGMFETLQPAAIITDAEHRQQAGHFAGSTPVLELEALLQTPVDPTALAQIQDQMVQTDPLYVLYTSGSTGRPKGAVLTHQAVLAYIRWAIDTFDFHADCIFGSQTPFYFSMSVTDLFGALCSGGRLQIIPRQMFSFPLSLVEYLNQYQINTIYWVPTALRIVANWDTFSYAKPEFLRTVLFAGEVMPMRQLNYWRHFLPEVRYANLFGPTETTDICLYYELDRMFSPAQTLPIGRACDNCRILILDESGQEAEQGELYVGGPFLAQGYYHDPEKTAAAFVQNPCNPAYPEILYRTGDLVRRDADGLLWYLGRRDHQIKHMGYRIELGEIEAAAAAADGVQACVCVYDAATDQLALFYQGLAEKQDLLATLQQHLPPYMLPNQLHPVAALHTTASGKIDRMYYQNEFAPTTGG